jgi:hypothetical protein
MAEKIETINQFLRDNYGIDTDDSLPIFRVVWSEDQYEKRETKYTDTGIELLTAEIREVPKYSYLKDVYILERRVLVPEQNQKELAGLQKSYEPLWNFKQEDGTPIPPTIQGCKFVIDAVYAALGKKSLSKYKDPMEGLTAGEVYELNKQRIDKIQEELFGEESSLGGETHNASGSAIIVPENYSKKVH